MATNYIPGAYLNIKIDKGVIMFPEVSLAEIMVKKTPNKYCKNVIMSSKWKSLPCVQIQKALYGLLQSELFLNGKQLKELKA